jgi:hypothetical protein
MEFTYNNNRRCKKRIIFTKIAILLFNLFSIYYDYDNIKKDKFFTYYLLTLLSSFLSLCNSIRYEYAYYKILGHTFRSPEEFLQWKNEQRFKNITFILIVFEQSTHLYFVINTVTTFNVDKTQILYSTSYLIIYVYTILITTIMLSILIFCCLLDIFIRFVSLIQNCIPNHNPNPNPNRNGQQEPVLNSINSINTLDTVIYIDDKKECCICLDKNNNEWIRTQCNHDFHKTCINDWYKTKNTCPVCRNNL